MTAYVVIVTLFYVGTACYVGAAAAAFYSLWTARDRALRVAVHGLAAGAACYLAVFVLRWGVSGRVPLTTMTDALVLFALLASVLMLVIVRLDKAPALLGFYLPPLAVVCLINAFVAPANLRDVPLALRGVPLSLHVGLVFLAYALFLLASMTSLAYAFQAYKLKHRRLGGLFQRLPSLERLDAILYRLIAWGYPVFVSTLALGVLWAWLEEDLLDPRWWLSPKVVISVVMAVFYAAMFHSRRRGLLRGPKLAYLVCGGSLSLLASYVLLELMHLRTYGFWGPHV